MASSARSLEKAEIGRESGGICRFSVQVEGGRPAGPWHWQHARAVHEFIESEGFRFEENVIQDAGWVGGQHPTAKSLSNDLRKRMIGAVSKGENCRAVA
jgi:hypothetical protein